MATVSQPSVAPTRKVVYGAGIGVPAAVIAVWIAQQFGLKMTAEVATAFGGIITQLVAYFTKERSA